MPLPEELVFTVDEKVCSDISHAKQQYMESVSPRLQKAWRKMYSTYSSHSCLTVVLDLQIRDLQLVCYAFTAFGKVTIKQRKLHPDTFIQLAMQLAYYKLHKKYALIKDLLTLIFVDASEMNDPQCLFSLSQARKLLRDSNDAQVLSWQD